MSEPPKLCTNYNTERFGIWFRSRGGTRFSIVAGGLVLFLRRTPEQTGTVWVYLEKGRNLAMLLFTYLFFLVLFYCWTKRPFVSVLLWVLLHFAGIVVWMIAG